MEALGPAIDDAEKTDGLTPEALAALERLRLVLAFCGKRLGAGDPQLIAPSALDPMATAFESQINDIGLFKSDFSQAHLIEANNQADAAISVLVTIPGISTPEEMVALTQAATRYQSILDDRERLNSAARKDATVEVEKLAAAIEALRTETKTALDELKSQFEIEKQKLTAAATEQQKLFTDTQTARNTTYNETLLKVQDSLTKTLTDQQGQFSAAQESRSRDFTNAQAESQKRFGDLIAEHAKRLADQDAEFTTQKNVFLSAAEKNLEGLNSDFGSKATAILRQMEEQRRKIETLVGVIGNLGVTSGYQKAANGARRSMWLWQIVAVVAMALVICFAFRAFLPTLQGQFIWEPFVARVFLTVTVGVLAAYAASQADRFFKEERYNRKLALELAAIDPFIALLPQEQQQSFKLEIGRRTFAQEETLTQSVTKSPATTLDLLASDEGRKFLQVAIETAIKAVKGS
jgi:cellobiose-specific phosphotransferase system component IIA